ncbi:MAG: glycosyltransferase [Lachnospiraceae bacterium]|nr:glycosyltransferase [Lachnospiraceae bacterium]
MSADISVVVACYNSDYKKLKGTIVSVLLQKNVDLQLIIADDCSNDNHFDKIRELLREYDFDNFLLLEAGENAGTVANVYRAVERAEGEYLKLISPGDFLHDENVLCKWYEFCRKNDIDVSFGDALYYENDNGNRRLISCYLQPQFSHLYEIGDYDHKSVILNYFLLQDSIVGALYFGKTKIFMDYLTRIRGVIRYGEDYAYRLMLMEGCRLIHYDHPVVFYEYGVGISTKNNSGWMKTLEAECRAVDKMIYDSPDIGEEFENKIKYLLSIKDNKAVYRMKKYLTFPELLYWQLRKRVRPRYSKTNGDISYMEIICR